MPKTIQPLSAEAFTIPTVTPESDGTADWHATTLVVVRLRAQDKTGIGYSYGHECNVSFIRKTLFPLLSEQDPYAIPVLWNQMQAASRNFGQSGIAASSIAAVEMALWDLKARLLERAVVQVWGKVREQIPVYGSGGFTSFSSKELQSQCSAWVAEGISMVKMKVGRDWQKDGRRVAEARQSIGRDVQLFVDANGAYSVKKAVEMASVFSGYDVTWFEEPVTSTNLAGLHLIRKRAGGGESLGSRSEAKAMEIAAGEYLYGATQAREMLQAQAVDVLQADATRCGITGFFQIAHLCDAFELPLSAHTAPSLHAHLCCVTTRSRHVEYFSDHVRIEQLLFEGATTQHKKGFLRPDLTSPGFGLEFKTLDAEKFKVSL